jgi:DNA polymerase-4
MDAFFAAVETLANPNLRGKPLVVGGHPGGRGVAATASYEARQFGIHPGMSIGEAARRCPGAIFLPGDPPKYLHTSLKLLRLLRRFSPLVEPFSIDEAFVETTGRTPDLRDGRKTAIAIQTAIERELHLTASVGVGPNKLIAKMASRVIKPRGLTVLDHKEFRDHFWPQPVISLWGIGEKTASGLAGLGIRTLAQLASAPRPVLIRAFGVVGGVLQEMARGNDETPLIPYDQGLPAKSMGHEHTLARDESDPARLEALLFRLTEQVARRLRLGGMQGKTVTVKLRFSNFLTITRQQVLPRPTDEERFLYPVARELMHRNVAGRPLRLLGVTVSGLFASRSPAYLFAEDRRYREVMYAVDSLRDRFGENALTRAKTLTAASRSGKSIPPSHPIHHGRPGFKDD